MSKKVNQRLFRPLLNTDNIEQEVLPKVTDADDGKVLTVVDGEWDKADAQGGGGTKRGIDVSLYVTDDMIESVYIGTDEVSLQDVFDYGWENVSYILVSNDGNVSSGAFLLQDISGLNLPTPRVSFAILSFPAVMPDTTGYTLIRYITITSSGSYIEAYNGGITTRKF